MCQIPFFLMMGHIEILVSFLEVYCAKLMDYSQSLLHLLVNGN